MQTGPGGVNQSAMRGAMSGALAAGASVPAAEAGARVAGNGGTAPDIQKAVQAAGGTLAQANAAATGAFVQGPQKTAGGGQQTFATNARGAPVRPRPASAVPVGGSGTDAGIGGAPAPGGQQPAAQAQSKDEKQPYSPFNENLKKLGDQLVENVAVHVQMNTHQGD